MAYGMASFDGSFPAEEGFRLIQQYMEAGGNFIDTAHAYSFWVDKGTGASERFVGAAAREFGRENLVIATKGAHVDMSPGYPRPDHFIEPNLVRQDLDQSLDRLGLPFVDIYYMHRDDPRVPAEELIEAANEHVTAGRARCLGASNWAASRVAAANAYAAKKGLHPFVILQNQWCLAQPNWTDLDAPGAVRFVMDEEVELLRGLGIAVAAYSSSGNGYFGKSEPDGSSFDTEAGRRRWYAARDLAKARGVTPIQIATAYLMNQPLPVFPILGTRTPARLADALGSADLVLSIEEIELLTK